MSTIEASTNTGVDAVGFESMERDDEKSKELAIGAATTTHFAELKGALQEVERAAAEKAGAARARPSKNAMITTFKIMKIVMETLRETSEAGKEANKQIKKEWKAISEKQSQNHLESKENMGSNQFYTMVPGIMKLVTPYAFNSLVDSGYHQTLGGTAHWLGGRSGVGEWGQNFMDKPFAEKWVKDDLPGYLDPVTKMGEQITGQFAQTEQYTNAVKESLYQHDVQTCTSDYQNGTQQQTSDKQSVDNAADTAKQLIRVQGEILMGKAG
jgi:hypothetical protein